MPFKMVDALLGAQPVQECPNSKVYVGSMSTTTTGRGLRVAELAAAAGVSPDTIRYYERSGLLPAPARTASGYRAYDDAAADRVKFIQGAQRLGLRLKDIADLLAIRDTGVCPCESAEQVLRHRLADLDAQMARLKALRSDMVAMIEPRQPGAGAFASRPLR
jgi:DNA-binding transcriptional MerR regulator